MYIVKSIQRIIFVMLACGMLLASIPTRAAGVDVVDIVRVIDASSPGKAGQEYIDKVRAELDAEWSSYVKGLGNSKEAASLTEQKRLELARRFDQEFFYVLNILMKNLKEVAHGWLNNNKRGAKVIVAGGSVLAVSSGVDVSEDILRLFNEVKVDFTKGR